MENVLFQHDDMVSREASPESTGSALSNITVALPSDCIRSSTTVSTTPPTSLGEDLSITSDTLSENADTSSRRRSTRHRLSTKGSIQNNLPGTKVDTPTKSSMKGQKRTLSGDMLGNELDSDETPRKKGHKITRDNADDRGSSRRKSTRLSTMSIMLKDGVGAATTLSQAVLKNKKGKSRTISRSLRPRASLQKVSKPEPQPMQLSPRKKAIPEPTIEKEEPEITSPPKPKIKRWEKQGLYVGQSRDFDPRRSESKNKGTFKRSSKANGLDFGVRDNTILPLPMFAGERLLTDGARPFLLPFDVFSPLTNKIEPKFKHIERNTFEGDAPKAWRKKKEKELSAMSESKCACTVESGCDEDCHNRRMNYECDDMNCNVGIEFCSNRVFAQLERRRKGCKRTKVPPPKPRYLHEWASKAFEHGVEVVGTENRGFGVRAMRSFERGQLIMEYLGEVIEQSECDRRMNNEYKDNENHYVMTFSEKMIIDATIKGSTARFINHSCDPNCEVIRWTVNGEPRMGVFSLKTIMTGEELTYDYNFENFGEEKPCHCGSYNCRGILGPKVPLRELSKHTEEGLVAGTKRKFEKLLGGSASRKERNSSKRRRIVSIAETAISKAKNMIATPSIDLRIAAEQKLNRDDRARRRSASAASRPKGERQSIRVSKARYSLPLTGSLGRNQIASRSQATIERFLVKKTLSTPKAKMQIKAKSKGKGNARVSSTPITIRSGSSAKSVKSLTLGLDNLDDTLLSTVSSNGNKLSGSNSSPLKKLPPSAKQNIVRSIRGSRRAATAVKLGLDPEAINGSNTIRVIGEITST